VLVGVDFFILRRWVGHIDEEALKSTSTSPTSRPS
jgi:hypothetical protein